MQYRRGFISMSLAVALFSVMDACMKALTPHYPPMQIAALRGLTSLPLVAAWAMWKGGVRPLLRVHWPLHLLRGGLAVLMLATFTYGIGRLPLADAYSLFFIAPLLITALAVPILGERVGWRRWSAIGVGFAGTLIVLRPTGAGVLTWGGLAVMVAATGYALSAVIVRLLGRRDSTESMVFWVIVFLSIGAGALALPQWAGLLREDAPLLVGLGLTGALGQWCITDAFRNSPASAIAPIEYTALLWGILLDWRVWHVLPDLTMLAGAGVIVCAGLYLMRREHTVEWVDSTPP